jgi:hypothetical protein
MGGRTPYPFNGGGDWICTKPDHWMFTGTGMKSGDSVPGLIGWEFHGEPAKLPGLEVVAEGTALSGGAIPIAASASGMTPGNSARSGAGGRMRSFHSALCRFPRK